MIVVVERGMNITTYRGVDFDNTSLRDGMQTTEPSHVQIVKLMPPGSPRSVRVTMANCARGHCVSFQGGGNNLGRKIDMHAVLVSERVQRRVRRRVPSDQRLGRQSVVVFTTRVAPAAPRSPVGGGRKRLQMDVKHIRRGRVGRHWGLRGRVYLDGQFGA